jgi:hypothetical protein
VQVVPETFFIAPDGKLLGKYPGELQSVEHLRSLMAAVGLADGA